MPKIAYRVGAVPRRAGLHRHEVRRNARRRARSRQDFVANYISTPSAQAALAAASGRWPGELEGGSAFTDPVLRAVRQGRQGRRPDAEHPADGRASGPTSARRGCGRRRARARPRPRRSLHGAQPARSPTRSASAERTSVRAPLGAPAPSSDSARVPLSATTAPHPPPDAVVRAARSSRAAIAFFSGHGRRRDQDRAARDRRTRSRRGRRTCSIDRTTRGPRVAVLIATTAVIDFDLLRPRRARAREVPAPGTVFLSASSCPDRLHDRRRVHELLDRPHPHEVRGDRRRSSSRRSAAGERQAVLHGARARRGRQARPASCATR